jgi:hypothetical protein
MQQKQISAHCQDFYSVITQDDEHICHPVGAWQRRIIQHACSHTSDCSTILQEKGAARSYMGRLVRHIAGMWLNHLQSKLAPPVTAGGSWMMNPMNSPSSSSSGSAGGSSRVATTRSRIRHPNFNIVFFSLGFTLPCSTAQLICALFTRIFDLDYGVTLFRLMFATYDTRQVSAMRP